MITQIDVQSINNGTAKCTLIIGPRRIPFEVGCCDSFGYPIDREQFARRLKDAAEITLRRDHQRPHHDRLIGTYTVDLDPLDDTPPRPPTAHRSGETITAEVFGNTHHVLLRFGGREITAHPNKRRNISVTGIGVPVTLVAVSQDGVVSDEVIV